MEAVELSGAEEARLTFTGAAFGLDLPERYGVVDIGGGSTELALGKRGRTVEQSVSVDVGAVRVSERFFPSLPPSQQQAARAKEMIASVMAGLFEVPSPIPVVGVAGTVTTLGALDRGTRALRLGGARRPPPDAFPRGRAERHAARLGPR